MNNLKDYIQVQAELGRAARAKAMATESDFTVNEIKKIMKDAEAAGKKAGDAHAKTLKSEIPWGGARVNILSYKGEKIDARTPLGKVLEQAGLKKASNNAFHFHKTGTKSNNVYTNEEAAKAAAEVFKKKGFGASMQSWWED